MEETIRYILSFLCRSEELAAMVGYSSDKREWNRYKVIILPSGFFSADNYLQPASFFLSFILEESLHQAFECRILLLILQFLHREAGSKVPYRGPKPLLDHPLKLK